MLAPTMVTPDRAFIVPVARATLEGAGETNASVVWCGIFAITTRPSSPRVAVDEPNSAEELLQGDTMCYYLFGEGVCMTSSIQKD